MTSDRDLIEASLERAGEIAGDLTPLVYARLFAERPELERLFWRDRDGAIKGEMLARAFEAILDFIGERHFAESFIATSAQIHTEYDVPDGVFGSFFRAIAETIRSVIGDEWTPDTGAAWTRLLLALDGVVTPECAPAAS